MVINLKGMGDEIIVGLAMVCFAMFAMIVLSSMVGQILLGFGLVYLIAIVAGKGKGLYKGYAYQIIRTNKDLLETLAVVFGGFIVFTLLSDVLMGMVPNVGSSISLYSAALQPVVTINTPIVQMLIWGVMIPILENCFFIGVIGYMISVKGLGLYTFQPYSAGTWISVILVGAIAASFHFISQLLTPELLLMDMVLFGLGMFLALKYNVLKHGIGIHIILNSIAIGLRIGWI